MFRSILNLWESCTNQKEEQNIPDVLTWQNIQKNISPLTLKAQIDLKEWLNLANKTPYAIRIVVPNSNSDRYYIPPSYGLSSNEELFTSGLFSCCALAICTDKENFFAHITADTEAIILLNILHDMKLDKDCAIVLWSGRGRYYELALHKILEVLYKLRLLDQVHVRNGVDNIDEYSEVGVNTQGFYCINIMPKPWGAPNGIVVRQGTAVASYYELVTDRLRSGSAIAFSYAGKNFLGVIDNLTILSDIETVIKSNFDLKALQYNPELQIHVWHTQYNLTTFSRITIAKLLEKLQLSSKAIDRSYEVKQDQEVGINSLGVIYSPSSEKDSELRTNGVPISRSRFSRL